MGDFNIKLINGEIVESGKDSHFYIIKNQYEIGGACGTLKSFLEYSRRADNIAVTTEYGNDETIIRVIPKCNILEYLMKEDTNG